MADLIDFVRLKRHTPYAQWQIVNVTFGDAFTDTAVRHSLRPPTPEHIDYVVLRQAQVGAVWHDMSGNRRPWRNGAIYLRSNVPNARVTLLLSVSHDQRQLISDGPSSVSPVLPSDATFSGDPGYNFVRADHGLGFGQDGDIYGLYGGDATSEQYLVLENTIKGGSASDGRADVWLKAQGWNSPATQTDEASLKLRSDILGARADLSCDLHGAGAVYEHGRSTPMGEWIGFTPTRTAATGTWTGGSILARYTLIGKTMTIAWSFTGTTTSNISSQLRMAIPAGLVSGAGMPVTYSLIRIQNAGGALAVGLAEVTAGATVINFYSTVGGGGWSVAAANTHLQGEITFEVQ